MFYLLLIVAQIFSFSVSADLPTNYEHYTAGGIASGLVANGEHFTLNGKEIRILSGSLHYFRVPKPYWRDRLLKMRAAGLNAVQFYSPWNLHEEIPGEFDFETGFLDLGQFLKEIKAADMFAMYRPGPYICAEWEFGGFPSWLLRDPHMTLRSNYTPFLTANARYLERLLAIVKEHQFSVNGGPVIAVQIENEFADIGNTITNTSDADYMMFLKNTFTKNGIKELLFTSDPASKAIDHHGSLPDLLETMNSNFLNGEAENVLSALWENQKRPQYVAEYWSGWFTHWGDQYMDQRNNLTHYTETYEQILLGSNASANIYMFHGGTNFGFMNGANDFNSSGHYLATITSYDYDAPLTEAGDYGPKYAKTKEVIEKLYKERPDLPQVRAFDAPKIAEKGNYGSVNVTHFLSYSHLLNKIKPEVSDKIKTMEELNVGIIHGQNFGFIVYRALVPKFNNLTLKGGVSDRGVILIDNKEVAVVDVVNKDANITLNDTQFSSSAPLHTLDIIVENLGRINVGHNMNTQRKGLNGAVLIDNIPRNSTWQIFALDFNKNFVKEVQNESDWNAINNETVGKTPSVYKAVLEIVDTPKDTFLKLDHWTKTVVFVNGFNIGRLWSIGPTKTLYVPASELTKGSNEILLFELHSAGNSIEFVDKPLLGLKNNY